MTRSLATHSGTGTRSAQGGKDGRLSGNRRCSDCCQCSGPSLLSHHINIMKLYFLIGEETSVTGISFGEWCIDPI